MTTSEMIFETFYKMQEYEVSRGATWDDVIDAEENWILDNCPNLFTIEKASDQLQKKIRSVNINRDIIVKILTEHNTKCASQGFNPIPEIGPGARRVIYSPGDFNHDGNAPSGPRMGLTEDSMYTRRINELKVKIHEAIVDDPINNNIINNKTFLCLLSLNFGQGQGGHFGLVVGDVDTSSRIINIAILDPYCLYENAFIFIFQEAFDALVSGYYAYDSAAGSYTKTPIAGLNSPFHNYSLNWQRGIATNYLESVSRAVSGTAPATRSDEYGIQSYWGQDHFCFMWCILFAHRFFITGTIDSLRVLYTEICDNPNINLVIIKAYIIQLLISLEISVSDFFNNCFKYVWTCYSTKNPPAGPLPPTDQTLYVPPNPPPEFLTYEIKCSPNNFFFNATVDSLGIQPLTLGDMPPITEFRTFKCSNKIEDKQVILDTHVIPDSLIIEQGISVTNSVFRIIHFYIRNYGDFVNPDTIYATYTNDQGLIVKPLCPSPEAVNTVKFMNLKPIMDSFKGGFCEKVENAIERRNFEYLNQNLNMSCDSTNSQKRRLHPHQQKAVDVMMEKAIRNINHGLLVWFGTGTGKTITANMVAKMTTLCNQYYGKCFIISTKSVFKSFAGSLGDDTGLTPDTLLPNPNNPYQNQSSAYYDRHTNTGSVPGISSRTLPQTDIYVFSSTRFMGIFMDPNTGNVKENFIPILATSMLIIDEAHKVINIDARLEGEYRFFNSCCRAARQVMLLTATPMVNSPTDMELLMALVDKREPEPKSNFKEQYVGRIQTTSFPNDICATQGIDIANFNLDVSYTTQPLSRGEAKFGGDRIIYAMPVGNLPANVERKLCISTDNHSLISALAQRAVVELENISTSVSKSFGSNETKNAAYSSIKIEKLIQIIKARENTPESNVIDQASVFETQYPDIDDVKFKYVIYSQSTTFLNKLKRALISSLKINSFRIDSITGNTQDRRAITKKYNIGLVRILLITDAAMEGVDLRRTSMVILAEPVWTKAKYDQIKGRGVRDSSGERLKNADYELVIKKLQQRKREVEEKLAIDLQWGLETLAARERELSGLASKSARIASKKAEELNAGITRIQEYIEEKNSIINAVNQDENNCVYALSEFRAGNIAPAEKLVSSINLDNPYPTTPYSFVLAEELDFCRVPATVDCMTIILSYSYTSAPGRVKYSIDTYKYNAMRVKNSEIGFFTQNMLSPYFIRY